MNSLGKLAILALAIDLTSCADDGPFYSGMAFNRPDEVAMADYLNSYGVLKSYVDRSRHPALKLGIGLPANDLTEGTGLNSLVITNADEAVTTSGLSHKDIIGNDGTVGAYAVTDLVAAAPVILDRAASEMLTSPFSVCSLIMEDTPFSLVDMI